MAIWAAAALAQRPSTLRVIDGSVEGRNVVYDPGTPSDVTKPAAGSCALVFTIKGKEFRKEGVKFTNLMSDASGKVTGFAGQLTTPFVLSDLLGTGCSLEIPAGQITYEIPNKLIIAGNGTVTFPFRSKSGNPMQATVKALNGQTDSSGNTVLTLDDVALKGEAAADGIVLPEFQLKSTPLDVRLNWSPSQPLKWILTAPQVEVGLGVPGLSCEPAYPLQARVSNISLNQDGEVSFTEADLKSNVGFKLPEANGFDFTLRGGKVRMVNSVPTFTAVSLDLTLPDGVTEETSAARAKFLNVGVDFDSGFKFQIGTAKRFKVGSLVFAVNGLNVDFSNGSAYPGGPPTSLTPNWMGIVLKAGTVEIPLGAEKLALNFQNFLLEHQGVTGLIGLPSIPTFKCGGFSVQNGSAQFELVRNQIKQAALGGRLNLPSIGPLNGKFSFDLAGKFAFQISAGQKIELAGLGLTVDDLRGRMDGGMLLLSGEMGFDVAKIQAIPDGFRQFKIGIEGLRVDPSGQLYLPTEGWITFPNPKPIDLGPITVELRRFGFTSENNQLDSVSFSGGAKLNGMGDALPVTGELDFEGFKIERGPSAPKFELGGIGLGAEVLGIGKLSASLYRETLPGFGDTLYGDAELKLTCLGDMAIGIGLDLLVAPEKVAFFIGGNVEVPPILVQIPPSGPNPPIPLFHITGFSGGFGLNVAPKEPGVGRVSDPKDQLKYSANSALLQAGLLLADQVPGAPGRLWWADTCLTLTINPVTIDLTARAAFLDPDGPRFLDLDDFHDLDRIAEVFMNLDLSGPEFTMGGKMDLTFPTRKASLFDAEGQAELKLGKNEGYIRVGWKEAGQKPLKVRFARAFENVADITAECGLEIVFPKFDKNLRVTSPARGGMYLKAKAEMGVSGLEIDGKLKGNLKLDGLGGSRFSASGDLKLEGKVDFGFFTAHAEGSLDAEFNTAGHRDQLYLSGRVRGKAGILEGDERVTLVLPVKK